MEEFELILKKNIRYIHTLANKLAYKNDYQFTELVQVGRIAIYSAYLSYNEELNNTFMKYAGPIIYKQMCTYLSKNSNTIKISKRTQEHIINGKAGVIPITGIVSLSEIIDDENDTTLANIIPSEPDIPKIDYSVLYEAIDILKDRYQIILRMHIGLDDNNQEVDGMTFDEIGSILNISAQGAQQQFAKAMNKLKKNHKVFSFYSNMLYL